MLVPHHNVGARFIAPYGVEGWLVDVFNSIAISSLCAHNRFALLSYHAMQPSIIQLLVYICLDGIPITIFR